MNIGAYFYNNSIQGNGGRMEAVLNIKDVPDRLRLDWRQQADGLRVLLPNTYRPPVDYAAALKVTLS